MTTPPVSPHDSVDPTPTPGASTSADAIQAGAPHQSLRPNADDEPMRLITSFNDVFVVVASALLMFGTLWLTSALPRWLGTLVCAALIWGLSEIFVRRRRMALPALCYCFGFIATFASIGIIAINPVAMAQLGEHGHTSSNLGVGILLLLASSYAGIGIATALYWHRFRVPVTIAMGIGGVVWVSWLLVLILNENLVVAMRIANIIAGLAIFVWALRWDAQDPQRTSIRSDVAFWLHLLAACMVTHPIFWALMPDYPVAAIGVFVVLTVISLVIDRRALMMSSLLYVISAILSVMVTSTATQSLAVVAVVVGGALLLLSAFWHPARAIVLKRLPASWRARLPQ
ncbi:MAG: hypothetical protein P4M06_17895 [Pandoraea sp.]|nr:hypothetical protein [Pandoraea sp.]MDR3399421.1 hypothetical protein [Pandoraea sp.]